MRSAILTYLVFAGFALSEAPVAVAQDPSALPVVAIDEPTAELLRTCFPATKVVVKGVNDRGRR